MENINKLTNMRVSRGLSISQLSRLSDVPGNTISTIESRDNIGTTSFRVVAKFSKALNCSIEDLV